MRGAKPTLRISVGCDRREEVAVRSAGLEQQPDAVVGAAGEAEPDPLDQVVDRFGRLGRHPGDVR